MKYLQVIESAYRGTLEEQDDTIIWLTHAMRDAGANVAVLLRGNAVNYAVKGAPPAPLSFGAWTQTFPPDVSGELNKLLEKNVQVYAVREDIEQRGIAHGTLIPSVECMTEAGLPELYEQFDRICYW